VPVSIQVTQPSEENLMSNVFGARAHPVTTSTNKARGGVTGHHVRYVLAFGLTGIVFGFILVALFFGFGSN
jgi:hypothetical protein